MWPASASSASDPDTAAPITSATRTATVRTEDDGEPPAVPRGGGRRAVVVPVPHAASSPCDCPVSRNDDAPCRKRQGASS